MFDMISAANARADAAERLVRISRSTIESLTRQRDDYRALAKSEADRLVNISSKATADNIVTAVLNKLQTRIGFGWWYDNLEHETMLEIKNSLAEVVMKILDEAVT